MRRGGRLGEVRTRGKGFPREWVQETILAPATIAPPPLKGWGTRASNGWGTRASKGWGTRPASEDGGDSAVCGVRS